MKFVKVSEIQICKIVDLLKPKKSCGLDGISNILLKRIISVIKRPLCQIINRSLSNGIFPDLMKIAKVQPLYKAGDIALPDNFRPISLLPVLSKVLERVVFRSLSLHLKHENVIYPRQYGFRKDNSTIEAIMNLVGESLLGFDNNQMILSVFFDLKKAFDTVSHKLILLKLEKLGVRGIELEWFRDYLANCRQITHFNGKSSSVKSLHVGVQQGSLLRVLLFKIIINNLPRYLKFSSSILYADDTTLFIVGKSVKFLRMKMQKDLELLSAWLSMNNLKLNVKKTECLLFNKDGLTPDLYL